MIANAKRTTAVDTSSRLIPLHPGVDPRGSDTDSRDKEVLRRVWHDLFWWMDDSRSHFYTLSFLLSHRTKKIDVLNSDLITFRDLMNRDKSKIYRIPEFALGHII